MRTRSWPTSRTIISAAARLTSWACTRSTSCGRPSRRPPETSATASPRPTRARASSARRRPGFGDYSTNAAMLLAPALGAPPREIAERLGAKAQRAAGGRASTASRSPGPASSTSSWPTPGTSNAARGMIVAAGDDWGRGTPETPLNGQRRVRLGQPDRPDDRRQRPPRRVRGRARAACSSSPATRSAASTTSTTRASQIDRLGASVRARARHEPVPEDGYKGDYVAELAARRSRTPPSATPSDAGRARPRAMIMEGIRATLHAYRVDFDTYFLEGSLHEGDPSPIDDRLRAAARAGPPVRVRGRAVAAHDRRSATTRTACCERSTGAPTYFAADVAYQEDKFRRGFDKRDLRPRRRPPRLHRAAEGDREHARARTRTASRSRSCSSCTSSRAARRRRCPSAAATS